MLYKKYRLSNFFNSDKFINSIHRLEKYYMFAVEQVGENEFLREYNYKINTHLQSDVLCFEASRLCVSASCPVAVP